MKVVNYSCKACVGSQILKPVFVIYGWSRTNVETQRIACKSKVCDYQSLVDLVMINAKLDREDHDMISVIIIGRGLRSIVVRTDLKIRLN
jgi:hypothetical protein